MVVNIPLCYLPNSKFQRVDLDTCKRTEFQVREVERIGNLPDFAFFTCDIDGEIFAPEFEGAFMAMWYTKDGAWHASQIKPDQTVVFNTGTDTARNLGPVPLTADSYVYRTY